MVQISLPDNYLLLSDSKQWIIAKQTKERVSNISFHTNMISALESYFELKTRLSDANSVFALVEYQKTLLTALHSVLQPLDLVSVVKNIKILKKGDKK